MQKIPAVITSAVVVAMLVATSGIVVSSQMAFGVAGGLSIVAGAMIGSGAAIMTHHAFVYMWGTSARAL